MVAAVPRTSEFQVSKNSMCQSQNKKVRKKRTNSTPASCIFVCLRMSESLLNSLPHVGHGTTFFCIMNNLLQQ